MIETPAFCEAATCEEAPTGQWYAPDGELLLLCQRHGDLLQEAADDLLTLGGG